MQYLKSFLAGFSFIVVSGLCIQLAYIFLAVWYIDLVKEFPWVATYGGPVSYLIGIVVYFLLMATGGLLTASIAKKNLLVMCFLVGIASTGLSMLSLQSFSEFTLFSLFFIGSGVLFTIAGGWYWKYVQA